MPVLPLVASRRLWVGERRPRLRASVTMAEAARSFTEPPGLVHSALPRIWIPEADGPRWSRRPSRRRRGVLPMRSRMVEPRGWTVVIIWSLMLRGLPYVACGLKHVGGCATVKFESKRWH